MAEPPRLSKQVSDLRLETEFLDAYTEHLHRVANEEHASSRERWRSDEHRPVLGSGSYGIVRLERSESDSSLLRAVKQVKKNDKNGALIDYARELEAVIKFSSSELSHRFVCSGGWFENETSIFIVMEYLKNGDLNHYLGDPLPETEAQLIISQILEGLGHMHDHGFVHRDLKPGNIMVDRKGPSWQVKIADFGVSKQRRLDASLAPNTVYVGTIGYAAPEQLAIGKLPDSPSQGFEADIWSVGVIAFRVLTGVLPFADAPTLSKYAFGKFQLPVHLLQENGASENSQDFIRHALNIEPQKRMIPGGPLAHPWMQTMNIAQREPSLPIQSIDSTNGYASRLIPEDSELPSARWTVLMSSTPALTAPGSSDEEPRRQSLSSPATLPKAAPRASQGGLLQREMQRSRLRLASRLVETGQFQEAVPTIEQLLDNFDVLDDIQREISKKLAVTVFLEAPVDWERTQRHFDTIDGLSVAFNQLRLEKVKQWTRLGNYSAVRQLLKPLEDTELPPWTEGRSGTAISDSEIELRLLLCESLASNDEGADTTAILILHNLLESLPSDHHQVPHVEMMLAQSYYIGQELASAKRYGEKSVSNFMESLGPDARQTVKAIELMRSICETSKDPDESIWRETALELRRQALLKSIEEFEASPSNLGFIGSKHVQDFLACQKDMIQLASTNPTQALNRGVKYLKEAFSTSMRFCPKCIDEFFVQGGFCFHAKDRLYDRKKLSQGSQTFTQGLCYHAEDNSEDLDFSILHFFAVACRRFQTNVPCMAEIRCILALTAYDPDIVNAVIPCRREGESLTWISPVWMAATRGAHDVVELLLSSRSIEVFRGSAALASIGSHRRRSLLRADSITLLLEKLDPTYAENLLCALIHPWAQYPDSPWCFSSPTILAAILQKLGPKSGSLKVYWKLSSDMKEPALVPLLLVLVAFPFSEMTFPVDRRMAFETLLDKGADLDCIGPYLEQNELSELSAVNAAALGLRQAVSKLNSSSPPSSPDSLCDQIELAVEIAQLILNKVAKFKLEDTDNPKLYWEDLTREFLLLECSTRAERIGVRWVDKMRRSKKSRLRASGAAKTKFISLVESRHNRFFSVHHRPFPGSAPSIARIRLTLENHLAPLLRRTGWIYREVLFDNEGPYVAR